jgi:hypothetical protein
MAVAKDQTPHPDDFMLIQIGFDFRAKENPANAEPWPVHGPTGIEVCRQANEETAKWLEEIARAIRERRLYGFMAQFCAETPVETGAWIEKSLSEALAEPEHASIGTAPRPSLRKSAGSGDGETEI